jgi:hypothetical protein
MWRAVLPPIYPMACSNFEAKLSFSEEGKLKEATKLLCLRTTFLLDCLLVNGQDSKAEIFDVFLCDNGEDKPAVREIARELVTRGIKPWLYEE